MDFDIAVLRSEMKAITDDLRLQAVYELGILGPFPHRTLLAQVLILHEVSHDNPLQLSYLYHPGVEYTDG